jgi:hypothetical protein
VWRRHRSCVITVIVHGASSCRVSVRCGVGADSRPAADWPPAAGPQDDVEKALTAPLHVVRLWKCTVQLPRANRKE